LNYRHGLFRRIAGEIRAVEWTEGQGISYRQGFEHLITLINNIPKSL